MSDVNLEIGMTETGTPVLKNIRTVAEQSFGGVQAAVTKANGALNATGAATNVAEQGMKKAQGAAGGLANQTDVLNNIVRELVTGVLQGANEELNEFKNKSDAAAQSQQKLSNAAQNSAITKLRPGITAVAGAFGGLGGAASLASSAIIAFATATGPLGIAIAAVVTSITFLVYRIQQAREEAAELAQRELDAIARDTSFVKLEQNIRNSIRAAEAGPNKIRAIRLEMDALRVSAEKTDNPKTLQLVDRLQNARIAQVVREARQAIEDQIKSVEQQTVAFTGSADQADQYALKLANAKAANEGLGGALSSLNARLIEQQRNLKDAQVIKSLGDQRDALAAQRKELLDGASAADDFRFSIMAANLELQVSAKNLADAKNALQAYREEQLQLRAAQFGEQVKQLEVQVTGELTSEVSARIAAAQREYDERIKLIERWKEAAERAGQDVTEQANRLAQAAADSLASKTDPMAQLKQKIQRIDIQSEVLGPDFDTIQPKIQAVTDALIDLIQRREDLEELSRRGFLVDPEEIARTAAEIEILKQKLEELRQAQKVKEAIDNIADGIGNAFDRALRSTASFGERVKGFLKDTIDTLNRELTKLLVIDPLKDWLKKQIGGIFGKIGLPTPDSAGIAAIQATQTAATTAIQLQSTTAQTGLQTEQSTAIVAIQAEQATATAAIEAVQATAIAAIQAAAASSGGSSGGGGGGILSLFGLGGSDGILGLAQQDLGPDPYAGMMQNVDFAHSGGVLGRSVFPQRPVPMALFAGAPRAHKGAEIGLKPGEVPLVGRVGERVSTPEQWEAATKSRGGGRPVNITNNYYGPADKPTIERSKRSMMRDMKRLMEKDD